MTETEKRWLAAVGLTAMLFIAVGLAAWYSVANPGPPPPTTTTTTSSSSTSSSSSTTAPSSTLPPTTEKPTTTVTTTAPPSDGCALELDAKSCWSSHTGVPGFKADAIRAGQSPLQKHVGVVVADRDGQVLDGLWVEGCIVVRANNVTVRNSYIWGVNVNDYACTGGNRQAGASALNNGNGNGGSGTTTGLKIVDTEIDGHDIAGYSGGVADANYSCTRCDVHGFTINVWALTNATVIDSFVHDNNRNGGDNHADGVMADSGKNVTLTHNWIAMDGGTSWTTAAVNFGGSWEPANGLTLDRNFLMGNTGSDLHIDPAARGVRVTDNAFSNRNGYGGTMFISGAVPGDAIWTGNYVAETGAPLPRTLANI